MSRSDDGNQRTIVTPACLFRKKKKTKPSQSDVFIPNRPLGLAWILFFRRVDFVWLLMNNSELLRIKNGQKTPYKKQKTASSHKKNKVNVLMTVLGYAISYS